MGVVFIVVNKMAKTSENEGTKITRNSTEKEAKKSVKKIFSQKRAETFFMEKKIREEDYYKIWKSNFLFFKKKNIFEDQK